MQNDKLKAVLGDDGLAELEAFMHGAAPLHAPVPVQPEWQKWAMGTMKSWSMWLGALLLALPDLLPMISPQLEQMLDANAYKRLMNLAGVVVILLRFRTNRSVKEKGTAETAVIASSGVPAQGG